MAPDEQRANPPGQDARESKPAQEFKRLVRYYMGQTECIRRLSDEAPLFPQLILIEPTNACNLRCVHCHHHEGPGGRRGLTRSIGVMNVALFRKVIDEIAPLHTAITLNVQGEPTLHPAFVRMVAYAKQRQVHSSVLTNATRLTEGMSRALIDLGLDRIVFSFDAVEESIYESIRIRSKFKPTLSNILRFIRMNHESGHHTHVCMSMVEQQRNRAHAETYERYFNRLPVDKVFRNPLLNLSGASGTCNEIDLAQLRQGPRESWPICRVPWECLTVNWDGEVCPCPVDVNVVFSVGNVAESSLQDIWNNERMQTFRRAHLTRRHDLIESNGPLCGSCNCLWDADYDLRRFDEHAVEAIYRSAEQFAHRFKLTPSLQEDDKYKNLLAEMDKLDPVMQEV